MFIPSEKKIKVGDRIELIEPLVTERGTFTVGHVFKVVRQSERGFDLEDFDGMRVNETGHVQHTFRKVSG